eukprot:PhM_4_TR17862/c0_g1_i3/m.70547
MRPFHRRPFHRAFAIAPKLPTMTCLLPFSPSMSVALSSLPTATVAAVFHSTSNNNNNTVQLEKGAAVDATDKDGWTVLHIASRNGDTAMVQLLLENGAAVDAKNKDQYTPLFIALR